LMFQRQVYIGFNLEFLEIIIFHSKFKEL